MKQLFYFSVLIVFISARGFSQEVACGEQILLNLQKANVKGFEEKQRKINLALKNFIDQNYKTPAGSAMRPPNTPTVYYIPVVFHVVHPSGQAYGTGSNLSYVQLQSQIDALNAAFAKDYPAYNGQSHPTYAQNTNIRFCLARIAAPSNVNFYAGPSGTEYGVMRYANTSASSHNFNNAGATAILGVTHPAATYFPFSDYLNIWIVSNIVTGGQAITMGYGTPPTYSYPLNGIVMRSDVVGDNSTGSTFNLGYGLQQGKILVHEAGHWLNLRHIFEGGCSGANAAGSQTDACDLNGDCICDIEPSTTQNIFCNQPVPNTCAANYATGTTNMDMIESYMSYAEDDCMNTFTSDQTQRMWATLNTSRANLWSLTNLGATGVSGPNGCNPSTLFTNINVSLSGNCINTPIAVSNPTTGNTASSWSWTATGANVVTANTPSVLLTYTAAGLYNLKLAISDGTTTLLDSVQIAVANCSLDPNKLNRSTWMFGDYCAVNFATGQPVPNNTALANNTIKCFENAVSMCDSAGNLLFYSNGRDLWNASHQQVNTSNLFGWDLIIPSPNGYNGTSVSGFMSFPVPKQPGKYYLVCVPPYEIKGQQTMGIYARIAYVIYDAVANTVTPFQNLNDPNINYIDNYPTSQGLTENLCVIPHCNGVDYWIITRGTNVPGTSSYFYSFLVNQNILDPYTVPVMSGPYSPSLTASASDLKSNSTGNKLVAKAKNKNRSFIYDFDASTGLVQNPVLLPSSNTTTTQIGASGIIFSPNDQYIYSANYTGIDMIDVASNTLVKTITPAFGYNHMSSYFEIGPDNIIYMSANSNGNALGQITNPNSAQNSTLSTYVGFSSLPGCNPNISILNFMEAVKPVESDPIIAQAASCSSYSFSLNPCWKSYTTIWNFGDGSATSTSSNVVHNYANPGTYTISLNLLYQGTSIPAYTRTINITSPANVSISGPSAICLNSTFLNSYGVTQVPNATYSWTASNAIVSGPNTMDNISAGGGTVGIATLSVLINYGGCNITATKTINIVDLQLNMSANATTVCTSQNVTLTTNHPGGVFTGATNAGIFNNASTGVYTVSYAYTDANGCYKTISVSIQVITCNTGTGLDNLPGNKSSVSVFPNPVSNLLFVNSPAPVDYIITNPLGQLIMQGTYTSGISLAQLSDGLYFITLSTNRDQNVKLKFIKE